MNKFIERLKNIGPGALVAAAFIGPGTVTTATKSGASSGYTLLWAMLFSTIATIIFQEMAARLGIVTQKGLGENINEKISSTKFLNFLSTTKLKNKHTGKNINKNIVDEKTIFTSPHQYI